VFLLAMAIIFMLAWVWLLQQGMYWQCFVAMALSLLFCIAEVVYWPTPQ
jgi:hypothetical protein